MVATNNALGRETMSKLWMPVAPGERWRFSKESLPGFEVVVMTPRLLSVVYNYTDRVKSVVDIELPADLRLCRGTDVEDEVIPKRIAETTEYALTYAYRSSLRESDLDDALAWLEARIALGNS